MGKEEIIEEYELTKDGYKRRKKIRLSFPEPICYPVNVGWEAVAALYAEMMRRYPGYDYYNNVPRQIVESWRKRNKDK